MISDSSSFLRVVRPRPGPVGEAGQHLLPLGGQADVVLAGLGDPQMGEVELADVHAAVLPPGQPVEQVLTVQIQPFQLAVDILWWQDLRQEAVFTQVVAQIGSEHRRGVEILVLECDEPVPGGLGEAIERPMPPGHSSSSAPVSRWAASRAWANDSISDSTSSWWSITRRCAV